MPENNDADPRAHAEVENVAFSIRHAFINRKSTQMGKRYRPADRHDNDALWERAALNCISLNGDPLTFVNVAFQYNTIPGGPFPQQLGGQAVLSWYAQHIKTLNLTDKGQPISMIDATIDQDLKHILGWMQCCWDRRLSMLRDDSLWHFEAYARCIMEPKDEIVIQRFGRAAHAQLTGNPALVEALLRRKFDLSFMERFNT